MEIQQQKSEYTGCNNCKHTNVDARDYPCNECKNAIITFDHYKPMTNADRIRNFSDEELAEWLHNICQFESSEHFPMISIYNLDTKCEEEIGDNYKDLIEWLQAEVEEGKADECN